MTTISFYIDDREPVSELSKYLHEFAADFKVSISVYKAHLELYDILAFIHPGVQGRKLGFEIKRFGTNDFKDSLQSGHLHDQNGRYFKHEVPFWWLFIGDESTLNLTEQKALKTVCAEIDMIGGHHDEPKTERMAMYFVMQVARLACGDKELVFEPYLEPTFKDDTVLAKMLKQFPGMGETAYELSETSDNFLDVFFSIEQKMAISMIPNLDDISLRLSNLVRQQKKKPVQKKPLKVIEDFTRWFFK